MSAMGTDVMALACILGSAAVGGVVTLAALERDGGDETVCVSEVHSPAPVVALSHRGEGHAIVVVPPLDVHAPHGCGAAVMVDVDVEREVRIRLDEARARMDEARARADEARSRSESARAALEEALGRELELRLEKDLKRMQEELARLEGGRVR